MKRAGTLTSNFILSRYHIPSTNVLYLAGRYETLAKSSGDRWVDCLISWRLYDFGVSFSLIKAEVGILRHV